MYKDCYITFANVHTQKICDIISEKMSKENLFEQFIEKIYIYKRKYTFFKNKCINKNPKINYKLLRIFYHNNHEFALNSLSIDAYFSHFKSLHHKR